MQKLSGEEVVKEVMTISGMQLSNSKLRVGNRGE